MRLPWLRCLKVTPWIELNQLIEEVRKRSQSRPHPRMRPLRHVRRTLHAQVDPLSLSDSVWSVDLEAPLGAFEPARSLVDRSLATRVFASTIVGLFSLLAFVLAGIGVYSVAVESMSRRTREIGIRCALGAQSRECDGIWS